MSYHKQKLSKRDLASSPAALVVCASQSVCPPSPLAKPYTMLATKLATSIALGAALSASVVDAQAAPRISAAPNMPKIVMSAPFAYAAPAGISPEVRTEPSNHVRRQVTLSLLAMRSADTVHRSRAQHVVTGALAGAVAGFAAGALYDRGCTGESRDRVSCSFEYITTPLGAAVGAVIGLLIPAH